MKILIGYDGSADADEALADLDLAALPDKAHVIVLTVAAPWPFFSVNEAGVTAVADMLAFEKQARENAEIIASRGRNHLEPRFPEWKVQSEVVLDFPAQGILAKAEAWKPDLIVMASHGHTAWRRLFLGSVSTNVINHAHTTVRINRARIRAAGSPLEIIVGMDGSPNADYLLTQLASRNWPPNTLMRLISVFDQGIDLKKVRNAQEELGIGQFQTEWASWMQNKLSIEATRFKAIGLKVVVETYDGDPRHVLLKRIAETHADCLFLGSHGTGALERFFLGSVSSSLASHAPCTVEIVRKKKSD